MASSFDLLASNLLCTEDDVFEDVEEEVDSGWYLRSRPTDYEDESFDETLVGRIQEELTDESLGLMLAKEREYLLDSSYVGKLRNGDMDFMGRTEAVNWIVKVHIHFNFSPICVYLAITYMDRFLSAYESESLKGKAWMIQLLAVACVSIAVKMEENAVPLSLLQIDDPGLVFDDKSVQRMELLVLTKLKWRMKAITPFCFLDFFLKKLMNKEDDGKRLISRCLIHRSIQLIVKMIVKGIDMLEFKPSEIAAAMAISVVGEVQTVDLHEEISGFIDYVERERVLKCLEVVQRACTLAVVSYVPQSPDAVLDAACLSYDKTDESTSPSDGSCSKTFERSSSVKRRKL